MHRHYSMRVFPFGYPRVIACLRLIVAFRSLPRPSSALSAKASTVCPYSLDLCSTPFLMRTLFLPLHKYCECIYASFFSHFLLLQRNCLSQFARLEIVFTYYRKTFPFIHCAVFKEPLPFRVGGDKQNRTADPLLARQVLSQLSYTPI